MKKLHATKCGNRDLTIKSFQAYQTNLIKPDKWNQLNVVTYTLLDVALTASSACMLPVALIEEGIKQYNMCVLPRGTCRAFEKMLDP